MKSTLTGIKYIDLINMSVMVSFQKTERESRLTCFLEHGMCCKFWKVVHIPLLNSYCFYVFEFLYLHNRDPKGDLISSLLLTGNCSYTVKLLCSHIETEMDSLQTWGKNPTTDTVSGLIPLPLTLQIKL